MQIELTAEEREMLAEVLASYVSELRLEVAGSDDFDYRTRLKNRESALNAILARLRNAAVA